MAHAALAPLGNYGGPTQTFALLPTSVAIGAGQPEATGATDSGPSAARSAPAVTDVNGQTSVTATTKTQGGSYGVTASAAATQTTFQLTNTGGAVASTVTDSAATSAAAGCCPRASPSGRSAR